MKRVLFRLGLSGVEVEDVAQEALVRVWRASAKFEGRSSVSTWACSIAINQGLSLLRGRRPPPLLEPEVVADPERDWERRERARVVRQAVLELPRALRSTLILREFEDLPYREIAEILNVPMGTVMSRLHDARARLRRRLSAE